LVKNWKSESSACCLKKFKRGFLMPLFDFYCAKCDKTFELLVKASASSMPACPDCGGEIAKQVSRTVAPGQSAGIIANARQKAAREGHFSNYKPSERPKTK
jgi:putative FmdB family regulatory protein